MVNPFKKSDEDQIKQAVERGNVKEAVEVSVKSSGVVSPPKAPTVSRSSSPFNPPSVNKQDRPSGFVGPTIQEANSGSGSGSKASDDSIPFYRDPNYFAEKERRRGSGRALTEEEVRFLYSDINYSKNAYVQYTSKQYEKASNVTKKQFNEYNRLKSERESIDPSGRYIDPESGQEISGVEVRSRFYDPLIKQSYKDYMESERVKGETYSANIKAVNLPSYVKVKKQMGSGFLMGNDTVAKAREEWKSLSGVQKFGKALFVGATQWPTTVYKPISSALGDKSSLSDEIIRSEAGSWERVQKDNKKDFLIQDVAFSPAMQEVYITVATAGIVKGASVAARPVSRGIIRGGAKAYRSVSRFVPEESFIARSIRSPVVLEGGSVVGGKTGRFVSSITKKPISKNFYNWAFKGYRKGRRLVYAPKGSPVVNKKGMTVVKGVYKADKTVSMGKRSIWLNPKEYAKFKSRVGSSGKSVVNTFDRTIAGVGERGSIYEKEILKPNMFKGLKRTYVFKRDISKVGVEVGSVSDDIGRAGFGSIEFYGDDAVRRVVDVGKKPLSDVSKKFRNVTKMYREGYAYRFNNLESGRSIVDFSEGFGGSGISRPTPKAWVSKVKYGLKSSKEASASLVRRSRQVLKPRSMSAGFGRRSVIKVPVGSFGSSSLVVFAPTVKTGFKSEVKQVNRQVFAPVLRRDVVSGVIPVSKLGYKSGYDQDIGSITRSVKAVEYAQKYAQKVDTVYDSVYKSDFKPVAKKVLDSNFNSYALSPGGFRFPFYPRGRLYGRAGLGFSEGGADISYKFRKFNVGELKF